MNDTGHPAEPVAHAPPLTWSEGKQPDMQAHYVARLRRLLQLRRAHLGELNQDGVWLLDRAIFATYCDCVEVGAGLAAQDILRSLPSLGGSDPALVAPSRRARRT